MCVGDQVTSARLDTQLEVSILMTRVLDLNTWSDIREEMVISNVLQRDNIILAKRLHPNLERSARIWDENAKTEKLWNAQARREVVQSVLDSWIEECRDDATVEVLLVALSYPDFKDMKMRIEGMIELSL